MFVLPKLTVVKAEISIYQRQHKVLVMLSAHRVRRSQETSLEFVEQPEGTKTGLVT